MYPELVQIIYEFSHGEKPSFTTKHEIGFRAVVLNLWVATPGGGLNDPLTGVTYQIFTLQFITVARLQL